MSKEKMTKVVPTFHGLIVDGVQHFSGIHELPHDVAVREVGVGNARYYDFKEATGQDEIPRNMRLPTKDEINPNAKDKKPVTPPGDVVAEAKSITPNPNVATSTSESGKTVINDAARTMPDTNPRP